MGENSKKAVLTQQEEAAVLDPFNNPEGFEALWTNAFARGARKAQEDNKKRGLDSVGTVEGRLAILTPKGDIKFTPK